MPDQRPNRAETGRELKALRERAGYSITAAAKAAGIGQPALSRYERGEFLVAEKVLGALCDVYAAPEQTRGWLLAGARENQNRPTRVMLHRPGDAADRQQDIGQRERDSTVVTSLGMTIVPGLLQTERYMRLVVEGGGRLEPDRVETWVANRLWRQRILTESGRRFVQIVSGPALLWGAGGQSVMLEQLEHLTAASRLPVVELGVIPPASFVDVFPLHNVDLYERATSDQTVIVGTLGGTAVLDDPFDIERHQALLDRLTRLAVWGDEARAVLDEAARWYR